jgi:hypothetical protein
MSILASLLPGVRDLRTPLSAGALWLTALLMFFIPRRDLIVAHNRDASALGEVLHKLPSSLAISAAAVVAFLLGNVAVGLTSPLIKLSGRLSRSVLLSVLKYRYGNSRLKQLLRSLRFFYLFDRLGEAVRLVSVSARGLVIDASMTALVRAKVPAGAAMVFPIDYAIDSLPYSAPQLSQAAATQYQEYDRLKSEAEFRVAIVPPLIAIGAVAPINAKAWVLVGLAVSALVLLMQAVRQVRASNDILANAAFLEHISMPSVQSVVEYLKELDDLPRKEGEWAAAIILGLQRRGHFEEAESATYELSLWLAEEVEYAIHYFEKNNDHDSVRTLIHEMAKHAGDPDQAALVERLKARSDRP